MVQLAIMFLLMSGAASLIYQVTWVRLLGLSMGSTSAAVSTVLAAFFLGLSLGSYWAERVVRHNIHSFFPYLLLEWIIGLSGLALLPALLHLDDLLAYLPDVWASHMGFKFALSMLLLIVPTFCMGATFPVMATLIVRKQKEMGLRISQLYSMNTAGAVLGAGLSGFLFIPWVGLDGAVYIAFTLNMTIVLLIMVFHRRLVLPPMEETASLTPQANTIDALEPVPPHRGRALLVLFCTGFVAIASEVGWTKYLAIFTGTTLYGFTAILTVFLIGIAAGSWLIRHRMQHMHNPAAWMAVGLFALGVSLLGTRVALGIVPNLFEGVKHIDTPAVVVSMLKYALVFVLLVLPTSLFGALFPINLKLYCGHLTGVRKNIGKAYAVNTVASIFGSIAAGFIVIPYWGTDLLLTSMALVILVLPLLFLPALDKGRARFAMAAGIGGVVAASTVLPHLDFHSLITSVHYRYDKHTTTANKPTFLYLGEGKSGIISAVTFDHQYAQLQNNGLKESVIHMHDSNKRLLAETLLGLLPYLLQEQAQSGFVVGFGGGVTSEALTWTGLNSIRVVELEPKVIDAVSAMYQGESPPALRDPRVQIDYNDARNTLLVENRRYDVIVSQPSHPWRAGAANVFTREFFQIVNSRLNDKGVFGQWVNLFKMDVTTLKAVLHSFYNVFPHGLAFANIDTGDLLLFGSRTSMRFHFDTINKHIKQPRIAEYLATLGVYDASDLFWYFALSRDEILTMVKDSKFNSDLNILSEVRLSSLDQQPEAGGPEDPYAFLKQNFQMDVWPYVPEKNAAEHVYEIGAMFLQFDSYTVMNKIIHQLDRKAPLLGRRLRYEHMYKIADSQAAIDLFNRHQDWPDPVIEKQVRLWLDFQ